MQTIDLYRSYLAQTAIMNAMRRGGVEVSGYDFNIRPGNGIGSGFTAESVTQAITSNRKIPWLKADLKIGFSLTTASIRIYADGWSKREGGRGLKNFLALRRELPGVSTVLTDEDQGIIAGIIHGQTYTIRVGVLPGLGK